MQEVYSSQSVMMKTVTRKLGEDESRLFDKQCPRCSLPGLIYLWDRRTRAYQPGKGRCASLSCKHGN